MEPRVRTWSSPPCWAIFGGHGSTVACHELPLLAANIDCGCICTGVSVPARVETEIRFLARAHHKNLNLGLREDESE